MKEAVNKVRRVTGPGGKPPSVKGRKARHISNWLPINTLSSLDGRSLIEQIRQLLRQVLLWGG